MIFPLSLDEPNRFFFYTTLLLPESSHRNDHDWVRNDGNGLKSNFMIY